MSRAAALQQSPATECYYLPTTRNLESLSLWLFNLPNMSGHLNCESESVTCLALHCSFAINLSCLTIFHPMLQVFI